MITGYKVVFKAKHLLTHSLIHSLAHSLTQYSSCQVAHKATTRERHCCRSAARLVVESHVPFFILFFQCSSPCSFCHPLFSVRLSWAMRLVTVGTCAQPSPSSPLDLCGQGCCGCYVEQLFVGDGVGPKYSWDLP